MRAGFGEERRELHSTHSLQGKIAVAMALVFGFGWCMLAWDHSMSLDYHFFSTMYGWQVFMGGWLVALMAWAVMLRWWKTQFPELPELITDEALPRHRQARLRLHGLLGLHHLRSVPRHLVRQPRRGDALLHAAAQRGVGRPHDGRRGDGLPAPLLRAPIGEGEDVTTRRWCSSRSSRSIGLWIVPLHRGLSVDLRHPRRDGAVRALGGRDHPRLPRDLRVELRAVHGRVPQGAGLHADVEVPRRGAGAGGSADDGAAAGA